MKRLHPILPIVLSALLCCACGTARHTVPVNAPERAIALEGVINARDMGGLQMADGRTVRSGMLLRSGNLSKATAADLRRLGKLAAVVDFRTAPERGMSPDRVPQGTQYLPLTCTVGNMDNMKEFFSLVNGPQPPTGEQLIAFVRKPDTQAAAKVIVSEFATTPANQVVYSKFLHTLLEPHDGAVLWHCTFGKDRTGFGTVLVLAALGADRATIEAEHAYSLRALQARLAGLVSKMSAAGATRKDLDTVTAMVGIHPASLKYALDIIDTRYGGMQSYLRNQMHLSEQDIQTLRNLYLD